MRPASIPLYSSASGVESVVGAYGFTTDLTGTDVLLSFKVEVNFELADLSICHLGDEANATWDLLIAKDLTYVDGWASFSGFSGYAVTVVPEPVTYAALLGCLALAFTVPRGRAAASAKLIS